MRHSLPAAPVTRRTVLAGAATVGAVGALAACGVGGGPQSTAGSTGPVTVATADVPVGGGTVVGDVVVTQPQRGTFKAFSSICTHQGCVVAGVQNGLIICPCHGSTFSDTDGSVQQGPAMTPLPAKKITFHGANLTVS